MRKPEKPYEYENLEDDFHMPYKNYGKFDYEVMKSRYMKLTNAPKQLLQVRYTIDQW
jgi:hypothetical protein